MKVLTDRLPPESATNTKVRERFTDQELAEISADRHDGGYGPWARTDYWFANLSDLIGHLIYVLIRVNGGKPDEPTPYPRPGLVIHSGDTSAPPDPGLVAMLEARRAERRAAQEAAEQATQSAAEQPPGGALACGCPTDVPDTGLHADGCAVR